MKPSLGDCDTQTLGIQPGGINWWNIQTEKWTTSFIFAYTREDSWDIQTERLALDSVLNTSSYILKTWMLLVLAYTPRVINCDVLWFHAKALETLLCVYLYNIMEVGHKWEQGTASEYDRPKQRTLQVTGPVEVPCVEEVECVICRAFLNTKNSKKYWKQNKQTKTTAIHNKAYCQKLKWLSYIIQDLCFNELCLNDILQRI